MSTSPDIRNINLQEHYVLTEFYRDFFDFINRRMYSGIHIYHLEGAPGTGKSSAIKYLTREIFRPENTVNRVMTPDTTAEMFRGRYTYTEKDGRIALPFIPGPELRMISKKTDVPCLLTIDEASLPEPSIWNIFRDTDGNGTIPVPEIVERPFVRFERPVTIIISTNKDNNRNIMYDDSMKSRIARFFYNHDRIEYALPVIQSVIKELNISPMARTGVFIRKLMSSLIRSVIGYDASVRDLKRLYEEFAIEYRESGFYDIFYRSVDRVILDRSPEFGMEKPDIRDFRKTYNFFNERL